MTSLLLSAGEASGDMYAARLAAALKQRADLEIFGMGGPQMRAAGVDIVTDYSEVSVVGITEILSHLPSLIRVMRRLVAEAERRQPAFAILTAFPGFHLRLANAVRPRGPRRRAPRLPPRGLAPPAGPPETRARPHFHRPRRRRSRHRLQRHRHHRSRAPRCPHGRCLSRHPSHRIAGQAP